MKKRAARVGAPYGGRVHNLLYELSGEFIKDYELYYNYFFKKYFFCRRDGYLFKNLIDCFTVIRTSRKCYRVMYVNVNYNYFCYFSARYPKQAAEKMKRIYQIIKEIEK